jgi:hypothetical protein
MQMFAYWLERIDDGNQEERTPWLILATEHMGGGN